MRVTAKLRQEHAVLACIWNVCTALILGPPLVALEADDQLPIAVRYVLAGSSIGLLYRMALRPV